MPLATTTYQPDTVTTNVPMNAAGGGPGGPDLGGFGQLLNQVAARRAAEQAQARQDRLEEQQYQREQQRIKLKMQQDAAREAENERNNAREDAKQQQARQERAIDSHPVAQRWMKYLPGIGPVEVMPGTFGAYAAGNVDPVSEARASQVGLRPGLQGTNPGYLTAGQTIGGKTPTPVKSGPEQWAAKTEAEKEGTSNG